MFTLTAQSHISMARLKAHLLRCRTPQIRHVIYLGAGCTVKHKNTSYLKDPLKEQYIRMHGLRKGTKNGRACP